MKTFTKPENLNGSELIQELAAAGIKIDSVYDFADGTIGFETSKEKEASTIVAAHNGTVVAPDKTAARKAILDRLGITADEAAILLG